MNLFKRFYSLFRKEEEDVPTVMPSEPAVKVTYGVSFLPGKEIKSIPIKLPDVGEYYKIDPAVGYFEVLSINPANKKVRVREACTDNELELSIRVFNYLLMKVDKYPMSGILSSTKQRK